MFILYWIELDLGGELMLPHVKSFKLTPGGGWELVDIGPAS